MLVCQKTHMYAYTELIPFSLMSQQTPFDTPPHTHTHGHENTHRRTHALFSLPWRLGQLVFTNPLVSLWNLSHYFLDSVIMLGTTKSHYFHRFKAALQDILLTGSLWEMHFCLQYTGLLNCYRGVVAQPIISAHVRFIVMIRKNSNLKTSFRRKMGLWCQTVVKNGKLLVSCWKLLADVASLLNKLICEKKLIKYSNKWS